MRKLFALLACLAAVGVFAGAARAATIVVNPGQSIQAAVDAANPGDTIVVQQGTYNENVLITKDGIKLVGHHAVLEPPLAHPNCIDPMDPEAINGICVFGVLDDQGNVTRSVQHVTVTGFTVRNFSGLGLIAVGADGTTFKDNVATDNGEYGVAAFVSTGTRILSNVVSGSDEAGIYVGDSPNANALIKGNEAYDNLFGVFVRNAEQGTIQRNSVHDNCVGVLFNADAPGPVGSFAVNGNRINHNTKACAESEESPPASGVGVLLFGAHDVNVFGNVIDDNVPSGPSLVSAGVAVMTGMGGTAPANNNVTHNEILRNQPDLFWDETGSGNTFSGNNCQTSVPAGLCP